MGEGALPRPGSRHQALNPETPVSPRAPKNCPAKSQWPGRVLSGGPRAGSTSPRGARSGLGEWKGGGHRGAAELAVSRKEEVCLLPRVWGRGLPNTVVASGSPGPGRTWAQSRVSGRPAWHRHSLSLPALPLHHPATCPGTRARLSRLPDRAGGGGFHTVGPQLGRLHDPPGLAGSSQQVSWPRRP